MAAPTKKSQNPTPVNVSGDDSDDEYKKWLKRFLEQLFTFIEKKEGQHTPSGNGAVVTEAKPPEGAGGRALPSDALARPDDPMSEAILEKAIQKIEQLYHASHAAPWHIAREEEIMRRSYRPGTGQTVLDFGLAVDQIQRSPEEREKRLAYYVAHPEYCTPLDTPKEGIGKLFPSPHR